MATHVECSRRMSLSCLTYAEVKQTGPTPDAPAISRPPPQIGRLVSLSNRFEWLITALVLFVSVCLHIRFATHVGGLWRDETNSVNLAGLPSLGEIWRSLDYDSFPILFFLVLRPWLELFGFYNDAALRVLGCIIGLGLLATLWSSARALGARWPVLSFALIGLNPMLIRYGDSTRAYGLGMVLILLTFGSFWRLVNAESLPFRRVVAATLFALLSVHCLFYNSILLLAIATGAVAVAIRARAWRKVAAVLSIGVIAAGSLIPYLPMMHRKSAWEFLVHYPADLPWLWRRSREVMGSPDPLEIWIWVGLVVAGLCLVATLGSLYFCHRRKTVRRERLDRASDRVSLRKIGPYPFPDAMLYAAVALIAGVVGYTAFLLALQYYTQPWYYITLAAFVACTLDVIFGAWPIVTSSSVLTLLWPGVRITTAVALLCLVVLPAWEEMPTRHTNVDLLGERLQSLAQKDDVIVVPRWECAITLCRYYRGPAVIVSLPPIDDHRFHRYDLVFDQIITTDSVPPVLTKIESALKSGHHVFVTGELPFPAALPALPDTLPVYRDSNGEWHGVPYDSAWPLRVGHFLRLHALHIGRAEIPPRLGARVQEFEKLDFLTLDGWH